MREKITEWPNKWRQPCEVYSRVMGYYRPVDYYNPWKKSEYYSRKNFDPKKSVANRFNEDYWL